MEKEIKILKKDIIKNEYGVYFINLSLPKGFRIKTTVCDTIFLELNKG